MLPKKERLTKKDFVGLRPRIIFRGTFVDIATHHSEITKFACIIAKKRVKNAVDRNRIKRKIYHILKECRPKTPLLIIVYPKQNTLVANKKQIQDEISQVFATL